jgi:hypothetical protein
MQLVSFATYFLFTQEMKVQARRGRIQPGSQIRFQALMGGMLFGD